MNERFFKGTITIYNQKQDEKFQKTVIDKVYVRKNKKITINSNGEEVASNASIIIPTKIALINNKLAMGNFIDSKNLDEENAILNFTLNSRLMDFAWTLRPGDYIVPEKCNLEFDITEIKKEYQIFQILNVSDNRKGNLQHFKIEVAE